MSRARDFHDTVEYQDWVLQRLKGYIQPQGKPIGTSPYTSMASPTGRPAIQG